MAFRHSIRFRLTSILIITVLTILIIVSGANMAFAETFYYQVEKENIATTYEKINNSINIRGRRNVAAAAHPEDERKGHEGARLRAYP